MAEEYWKSTPFGKGSMFHPDWDSKQNQAKSQEQQNGEIVGIFIDKGDYREELLKNKIVYDNLDPAKYRPPIYNLPPVESKTETVIITVSVTVKGNVDSLYISVDQNKLRATKQLNKYSAVFSIQIPKKEGKKQFEITALISNFIGNKTLDTKKIKVTIDLSGKELAREDVEVRKDIKNLKPSSKVFLFLKEKEGLGYNIERNADNEIVKVLPYDDGGKMGVGNATIGYGHLIAYRPFNSSNPDDAKWKDGITLEQAEKLLFDDVESKSKYLITGFGGKTNTSGIKVPLFQKEYDALVICIFNGGYGETLESTINKGVENLTTSDIFKAFLARRYAGNKESRGLIKRRAMEADIFINDNWMPYPSEKFKDGNTYIDAYKKFIQTGILPLIFFIISALFGCGQDNSRIEQNYRGDNASITYDKKINSDSLFSFYSFQNEYQFNEILFDINDRSLMQMDTVLYFSDQKNFFEVIIKKEKIEIVCKSWKEMPENTIKFKIEGIQKNGFIYVKNKKTDEYIMEYKIILKKGLFYWDENHWSLLNCGDF
jgi:GH24 family phage-related lysozyme (muramidase)